MEGQMASARYPPHIVPIVPCSVAWQCDLGFLAIDSIHGDQPHRLPATRDYP
jgi:hypothetical protein